MAESDPTDYQSAWTELTRHINYERRPEMPYCPEGLRLDRLRDFLGERDLLRFDGPSVQVAGSVGKGSTSAFAAALLGAAGHRVGLYTSPHLVHATERIRLQGRPVDEAAFAAGYFELHPALEERRLAGERLSFFDVLTALALLLFGRQEVSARVLEVGLGGRLDSTTAVDSSVGVIGPIELEHTDKLGQDLASIAAEKAAILRPGMRAVMGRQEPTAARVIEEAAARAGVPLYRLGCELTHTGETSGGLLVTLDAGVAPREIYRGPVPLAGDHQRDNLAVAAAAAWLALDEPHSPLAEPDWAVWPWPGRFETRARPSPLVLDVAHTAKAMSGLARNLLDRGWRPSAFVVALTRERDPEAVFSPLEAVAAADAPWLTAPVDNPRMRPPRELAEILRERGRQARDLPTLREALTAAVAAATADRPLVVTGSFYLVGEVMSLLEP